MSAGAIQPDKSTDSPIDELVLVVHGVGDPPPGETVNSLTRSISLPHEPVFETSRALWIHDTQEYRRLKATFPCHVRQMKTGGKHVEFAEVFWADLSRVRRGIFGALWGLFQVIFGLRYVAYVAADQECRPARWMQGLGLISSRILHGPVLAVNFVLGVLTFELIGTELLWSHSNDKAIWTSLLVAICAMTGIVAGAVIRRVTRNRVIERFWFWVVIASAFLGGLVVVRAILIPYATGASVESVCPSSGLLWYGQTLVILMGLLWGGLMIVVLAMSVCWFFARLNPKAYHRGLNAAIMLPVIAVGLWGQVLPMLWLTAQTVWNKVALIRDFDQMFIQAVPLLGVQCIMCIILGAIQLATLIAYAMWRPANDVVSYEQGARAPRLIINYWVHVAAAICTCVGVSLVFLLGAIEIFDQDSTSVWIIGFMAAANKYAIMLLVPMTGLFILSFRYLSSVLDIVLDVTNHFYFKRSDVDGLDDDDNFGSAGVNFESGQLRFCRRDAIHSRMTQVLLHYRNRSLKSPKLTIVAHSQGTVIAAEVLNDQANSWIRDTFSEVKLITMGSPISHLYQFYFEKQYPPLDQPFWSSLRRNVDRWVNVFRIDDFVGTEIDFPPNLQMSGGPTCSNHPVGNCGHTYYWCDQQVLDVLRNANICSWLGSSHDCDSEIHSDAQSTTNAESRHAA